MTDQAADRPSCRRWSSGRPARRCRPQDRFGGLSVTSDRPGRRLTCQAQRRLHLRRFVGSLVSTGSLKIRWWSACGFRDHQFVAAIGAACPAYRPSPWVRQLIISAGGADPALFRPVQGRATDRGTGGGFRHRGFLILIFLTLCCVAATISGSSQPNGVPSERYQPSLSHAWRLRRSASIIDADLVNA